MSEVHLRRITDAIEQACVGLRVGDDQVRFVATNAESLAQATVNPRLVPLAISDGTARGYSEPHVPMIGFVMYEIDCGVGFILRLMIDRAHQRKGYGRAALKEVIRRLRLEPEVEMIATRHRHDNAPMAALCRSLGFVAWHREGIDSNSGEIYLRLPAER